MCMKVSSRWSVAASRSRPLPGTVPTLARSTGVELPGATQPYVRPVPWLAAVRAPKGCPKSRT
jgi:hypothetical protein